jgi:hypothetical protein
VIVENKKKPDNSACKVQEQVEDVEEVLDPGNTCSVLNTVLNSINNQFDAERFDEAVRLLNVRPAHQSLDDCVPGHKYSIPGWPRTMFLAHKVWAIWFIVRTWVKDAYIPGALVADVLGVGKTLASVAMAMLCRLVSEKVVMGLRRSIV